jgi:hypothetical protein
VCRVYLLAIRELAGHPAPTTSAGARERAAVEDAASGSGPIAVIKPEPPVMVICEQISVALEQLLDSVV